MSRDIILLSFLFFFFASCSVIPTVGKDYKKPEITLPESFKSKPQIIESEAKAIAHCKNGDVRK